MQWRNQSKHQNPFKASYRRGAWWTARASVRGKAQTSVFHTSTLCPLGWPFLVAWLEVLNMYTATNKCQHFNIHTRKDTKYILIPLPIQLQVYPSWNIYLLSLHTHQNKTLLWLWPLGIESAGHTDREKYGKGWGQSKKVRWSEERKSRWEGDVQREAGGLRDCKTW